jgi:hypothetical protein
MLFFNMVCLTVASPTGIARSKQLMALIVNHRRFFGGGKAKGKNREAFPFVRGKHTGLLCPHSGTEMGWQFRGLAMATPHSIFYAPEVLG